MLKEMPDFKLSSDIDLKPRVFIRKMGGDYAEVTGVQSFERSEFDSNEDNVTFVLEGKQPAETEGLLNASDKYVDVKLEFSIAGTMTLKFSGVVESYTSDTLTLSMSTPIAVEVADNPATLH